MIYPLINKIKYEAIKHPLVNMSSIGAQEIFDNKAIIAYPYVNLDIETATVTGYVKTYSIRMYVMDRNEPFIAYNKTEVIADDILKAMDVVNYTLNYYTLEFQDISNGVYVDFEMQVPLEGSCTYNSLFDSSIFLEDGSFVLLENGDLIMQQN